MVDAVSIHKKLLTARTPTMESVNRVIPENNLGYEENLSNIYIGRQPIFDRDMRIIAYELLYRDSSKNQATINCQNTSTTTVILNLITEFGFTTATGNKTAFVNLSKDFLTGMLPIYLPADKVVLEILEDTIVDDALIAGLQQLKKQGFTLALDDFIYSSEWEPILPLVDYIKVEIPALNRDEIKQHVSRLKKYNVKLLAEKIESEEEYNFLHTCGFDLFQGYFLERPEVIKGKGIASNKLSILLLLAKLSNENITVDDLVKSISSDVSLCYKMLRHLNSAYYSLERKIESIHEAVTYVGIKKLKYWATLIALSNINNKPDDYMQLTMVRAYMCEQIAIRNGTQDTQPFFAVGLLSTLNTLLALPMQQILESLPLSGDMQNALLHYQGATGKVLECVKAYENGEWDKIDKLQPGLSPIQLRDSFFKAIQETNNSVFKNP